MLPPGHFAAGYLTTTFTISSLINLYPQAQDPKFLALGLFASLVPDLDEFYAFYKAGGFWFKKRTRAVVHRNYLSHAPLFYLIISAVVFGAGLFFQSIDLQLYAILFMVGTWTHFFFDSFYYGMMWAWPVNRKIYAFRKAGVEMPKIRANGFFEYWTGFLKFYIHDLVFYMEAAIIVIAISVYFLNI